jgi:hypothetical protein
MDVNRKAAVLPAAALQRESTALRRLTSFRVRDAIRDLVGLDA